MEEWDGGVTVANKCDRERGEGVRGASWANELQGPTVEVQRSERGWNRAMTECSQRVWVAKHRASLGRWEVDVRLSLAYGIEGTKRPLRGVGGVCRRHYTG